MRGNAYGATTLATQAFNPFYIRESEGATSPPLVYYGVFSGRVFHAIREIQEIAALPEDWDMEHGAAITAAAINLAATVVLAASKHGHRAPDVYPLNDGGILLEWRGVTLRGYDVLLQTECLPNGSFEMSITSDECTYDFSAGLGMTGATDFYLSSGFARFPQSELPAI